MKHLHIIFIISAILLMTGCSSESGSGSAISVTIDGQVYNFSGCGAVTFSGNEYDVSCTYQSGGEAKRIVLSKAYDLNGGEVRVLLTDIPDATQLDTPYGIEYECNNIGSPPCSTAAVPTFDAATTTITLSNVVIALSNNTTDYAGGTLIVGATEHTVSLTVDVSTIAAFL